MGYVIVTRYKEITHTYGDEDGAPFPTRAKARSWVERMKRREAEMYPDEEVSGYSVHKILGGQP